MSRENLRVIAEETDRIVRDGGYTTPSGAAVTIADAVSAAVRATVLYQPDDLAEPADPGGNVDTRVEVTGESTLDTARRLTGTAPDPVAALNFASARRPGGGFRSGAQAQEESLARSSALVACLESAPDYYTFHNRHRDARYTDRIIYSPAVPVFRDDAGTLLDDPYPVAFLTAAAPNVSVITDPDHLATVPAILRRRAGKVFAAAHRHGHRRLVLGAWGCGVFRNDPSTVAGVFAELLDPAGPFGGRFDHVVFAVLDATARSPRVIAFKEAFGASAM